MCDINKQTNVEDRRTEPGDLTFHILSAAKPQLSSPSPSKREGRNLQLIAEFLARPPSVLLLGLRKTAIS